MIQNWYGIQDGRKTIVFQLISNILVISYYYYYYFCNKLVILECKCFITCKILDKL
jgi:hypothetical protein